MVGGQASPPCAGPGLPATRSAPGHPTPLQVENDHPLGGCLPDRTLDSPLPSKYGWANRTSERIGRTRWPCDVFDSFHATSVNNHSEKRWISSPGEFAPTVDEVNRAAVDTSGHLEHFKIFCVQLRGNRFEFLTMLVVAAFDDRGFRGDMSPSERKPVFSVTCKASKNAAAGKIRCG